jgi:hypothetical protein
MIPPRKDRKRRHVLAQGEMQKHRCCFCRVPVWYEFHEERGIRNDMATYEHIIPASSGCSTTSKHNCLMSCWLCNHLRGVEDVFVFAERIRIFGREGLQQQQRAEATANKLEARRRARRRRARRRRSARKRTEFHNVFQQFN